MNSLQQRTGACAFFGMAVCYLCMFVIYGVVLSIPHQAEITEKLSYLIQHKTLISITDTVGYLVFGCLLLVGVVSLYRRSQHTGSQLIDIGSLFGIIWVGLMMSAGMISLIGLEQVAIHFQTNPSQATSLFYAYTTIVNGLGGGIELVGGLWVLLISIASIRHTSFPKLISILGILVGSVGVLTLLHTISEFKMLFGLSQIIWFICVGVVLLRKPLIT